jgi:large repetitive protein
MKRLVLIGLCIFLSFISCKKDPCEGEIAIPEINFTGSKVFCSGGSLILKTASVENYVYQWQRNGSEISGATHESYVATSSGEYQVRVNKKNCPEQKWSAPVNIIVNDSLMAAITPEGPLTICKGGKVVLYGNSCSGYTYQWRKNFINIGGATEINYTATDEGEYQLQVSLGNKMAWSALVKVSLKECN